MKVTIKNENKSSEIKYPCLMSCSSSDNIYYMMNNRVGFCLTEQFWGQHFIEGDFTPFTGTIELSND